MDEMVTAQPRQRAASGRKPRILASEDPSVRGTGRTTAIVRTMPNDGADVWFVVHHRGMVDEVRAIAHNLYGDQFVDHIKFATCFDSYDKLRGIPRDRIFWDHEAVRYIAPKGNGHDEMV